MMENKGLISSPQIEQSPDSSTALKNMTLAQVKVGEFADALVTAQQINNQWQRIEALKAIANAAHPAGYQTIALRALLHLPVAERNTILAQQVEEAKDCFLPGSEEMEWVEEYIEDDNWDDE
ncbi:hypothetical protein [Argonema galeatum]|uniref:hypothetical protein n=1 Tax=Argonema galeatum TaxID=2942762 RepID=UPI0020112156|nr:hypothetical protein [Argonema galeatum]MCL1465551.1 hypothetical protein [Argonema galeatum A003/A1]